MKPQNLHLIQREKHPEPTTEEEKERFRYRHNYPYRRQPKPGDYGVRRSTTTTTTTTPSSRQVSTTEYVGYHEYLGYQPVTTEHPKTVVDYGHQPVIADQPRNKQQNQYQPTSQRPRYQEELVHNQIQTESPPNIAGPFVTVHKETETDLARQPKHNVDMFVEHGSDSSLNEVRVLPPEEFRHLLARVDGIDRKVSCQTSLLTSVNVSYSG